MNKINTAGYTLGQVYSDIAPSAISSGVTMTEAHRKALLNYVATSLVDAGYTQVGISSFTNLGQNVTHLLVGGLQAKIRKVGTNEWVAEACNPSPYHADSDDNDKHRYKLLAMKGGKVEMLRIDTAVVCPISKGGITSPEDVIIVPSNGSPEWHRMNASYEAEYKATPDAKGVSNTVPKVFLTPGLDALDINCHPNSEMTQSYVEWSERVINAIGRKMGINAQQQYVYVTFVAAVFNTASSHNKTANADSKLSFYNLHHDTATIAVLANVVSKDYRRAEVVAANSRHSGALLDKVRNRFATGQSTTPSSKTPEVTKLDDIAVSLSTAVNQVSNYVARQAEQLVVPAAPQPPVASVVLPQQPQPPVAPPSQPPTPPVVEVATPSEDEDDSLDDDLDVVVTVKGLLNQDDLFASLISVSSDTGE